MGIVSFAPMSIDSAFAQVDGDIVSVTVDHNVYQNGDSGMHINVDFDVYGMRGEVGKAVAYFYYDNGTPLRDLNDRFNTVTGAVAVSTEFEPRWANTVYTDLEIFMPYDELHMDDGDFELKLRVQLFHESYGDWTVFASSSFVYFQYTSGRIDYEYRGVDELELESGFWPDPHRVRDISTFNSIATSTVSRSCAGYVSAAPDLRLFWEGDSSLLRIYFESTFGEDTILLINDPYGDWYCDDDSNGDLQPSISFRRPVEGQYDIWVGTYGEDETTRGSLYITEFN